MERTVTVLSDIKDLNELLQGARVDRFRILPSGGRLRLDLELTRVCLESAVASPGGFFRRKVPWVKSRLVLDQIRDAAFERAESASADVSLLACDSISGGYALSVTSQEGMRIMMNCDGLSGLFEDIGKPKAAP